MGASLMADAVSASSGRASWASLTSRDLMSAMLRSTAPR
jgi:hypothetical protein